jgi:hypothetical protein
MDLQGLGYGVGGLEIRLGFGVEGLGFMVGV